MALKDAYLELQNASDIKIGDRVKVLRKAATQELGWDFLWAQGMDRTVNQIFTVESIKDKEGFTLSNGFSYPFYILQKLSPIPPEYQLLDSYVDSLRKLDKEAIKSNLRVLITEIVEMERRKLNENSDNPIERV